VRALVVGGGFAGCAAAWELQRRGAEVSLVWEAGGASELYSGALDFAGWGDGGAAEPRELAANEREFLASLGLWAPGSGKPSRLAAGSGVVRPADRHDGALLDLELGRGRKVAVVDWGRPGWDAALLARAWSECAWSRETNTEFLRVAVEPPSLDEVRLLSDYDLAECFEEAPWQSAIAEGLRAIEPLFSACLVGPWLGVSANCSERLRRASGRTLGETLSDPGGLAGVRFQVARDAWLGRARLAAYRGTVQAVQRTPQGFRAHWRPLGAAASEPLGEVFQCVILALGGVLGGGVQYASGLEGTRRGAFSLSVDVPAELRLDGRDVGLVAGSEGADLVALGMGVLERVGVRVTDEQGLPEQPGLFAAGDVVAARPRTALEAIRAGILAASAAARVSELARGSGARAEAARSAE
jgi:putative NAD(P)-binding protein